MNEIKNICENIVKAFTETNFKEFIGQLLTFRDEVIKHDPQEMDPGIVDLAMDENMWEWASSAVNRKVTDFDWEAAGYIAADVQDCLKNM